MNGPPDKAKLTRQWIEKAEHDLRNAEHTLTLENDCPFDTACFHAQQCAEKYLKALLVFHEVDFPKTHDLILLENLAMAFSPGLKGIQLHVLNRYSMEARYPGDWEPITRAEAEKAIVIAKKVRDAARSVLPGNVIT
ncbi:MAG: HEPN domain-containing protein [Nitrospinae bacterium]|nr:HEPN domain-containing protein [Nitrospinota bacterium]